MRRISPVFSAHHPLLLFSHDARGCVPALHCDDSTGLATNPLSRQPHARFSKRLASLVLGAQVHCQKFVDNKGVGVPLDSLFETEKPPSTYLLAALHYTPLTRLV